MATARGFDQPDLIDVSSHQGVINWREVYESGVRYAYLRATMGASGVDTQLRVNAIMAKQAGLDIGFYCLLRPEYTGDLQATHFLVTLREDELDHDLPHAVDVEISGITSKQVYDWLQVVGPEAVVYTSASKWNAMDHAHDTEISKHRLWVAHYFVTRPTLPKLWQRYWLWQHSDKGSVRGVPHRVDLNQWGPADQLDTRPFTLDYPVLPPANMNQGFGENETGVKDFYTRWGLPGHEGVDFKGTRGEPIFAAQDGVIVAINIPGQGGIAKNHPYGIHVKLDHEGGEYRTEYAHLSKVLSDLKVGDVVRAGDMIGGMGNTGNVVAGATDGTHLHFMLRHRGATAKGELQTMPDGSQVVYKNDIIDPTPYFKN